MAEITKVTTPMVPRENLSNKYKPVSDQALELNDLNKVHKPSDDRDVRDRNAGGQAMRDNMGRSMVQPLFRETTELMYTVKRMISLLELGISTSEIVSTDPIREMLESLFVRPDELLNQLQQQEQSAVLFKGEAFDSLRVVMEKFSGNPRVMDALTQLLKTFEQHVNTDGSIKTILYSCRNILDYLFSQDRSQFSAYLDGLEDMLLPEGTELTTLPAHAQAGHAAESSNTTELQAGGAQGAIPLLSTDEQKEIAQIFKNNLLPLLGEIVVKYHQNERIRDIVMVVVHNIVRVDKGTQEALLDAADKLVDELSRLTNLPENYEDYLSETLLRGASHARLAQNDVVSRLADVISETLYSQGTNPAALRQAESLLFSLLQNQSSLMNVLHFVLPMQTQEGRTFAELYVDPEVEEGKGKTAEKGRKIFLSVDSEAYGSFEFSFWQTGERVDVSLWCPEPLVGGLTGMRRLMGDVMQGYGYSLGSYQVTEFVRPQTIAQVFPKLLQRKVGVDVRI